MFSQISLFLKFRIATLLLIVVTMTPMFGNRCDAFQAPSSESSQRQLVKAGDLKLVGGYRVPVAEIDKQNTRYLTGSFDRLNGKWIAHHGISGRIIEYREPGEMGKGGFSSWPELVPGRNGRPFSAVDKIGAGGVLWLDNNRVLCSGRKSYRSGYEARWVSEWNLSNSQEKLIPLYDSSLGDGSPQDTGNFHIHQAFGKGFVRIPTEFANRYTGGRTIGMGRGGYDVLGSPLGPALAAFKEGDTKIESILLDYPYQSGVARRDSNYSFSESAGHPSQLPMWKDPDHDGGYWISGDSSQPAWVDHSEFKGVVFCASQVRGTMDYRAQGDGGSGQMFAVTNPELFYSPDSSGFNRGGHEDEPQNQSLTPATYARVLYIYDPDQLADVANGSRNPWECNPTRYEFPQTGISWSENGKNPSLVRGLFWDNERQLLWASITNVWKGNKFAVLAAYQLGSDEQNEGGSTGPSSGGGGDPEPSNGSNDPPPSDGSNDPPPSDGSNDPPPSDGSNDPPPSDGSNDPPPSDGSNDPPPSDGSNDPPPSDGSKIPLPSDGNTPDPSSGNPRNRNQQLYAELMQKRREILLKELLRKNESIQEFYTKRNRDVPESLLQQESRLRQKLGLDSSPVQSEESVQSDSVTSNVTQRSSTTHSESPTPNVPSTVSDAPLLNSGSLRKRFMGKWGIPSGGSISTWGRTMSDSEGIHCIDQSGHLVMATHSKDLYGLGVFHRPSRLSKSHSMSEIPAGEHLEWRKIPKAGSVPNSGGTRVYGLLEKDGNFHWTMKAYDSSKSHDYPSQGLRDADGLHGLFRVQDVHHNKVAGYLAECPDDLGGDYLAGFCGPLNVGSASGGPALYLLNMSDSGRLPSKTLLEYGNSRNSKLHYFTGTTRVHGCAWIETEKVRGVVFAVTTGVGDQWHGPSATLDKEKGLLVDPYGGGNGYHSNAYEQQLWVYNPDDLRDVLQGDLSPSNPKPVNIISLREYEAKDKRNQPVALSFRHSRLTVTLANGYRVIHQRGGAQPLVLEFRF